MNEVDKILRATEHRPLNPNTVNHKKFLKNQIKKIEELNRRFPNIDFRKELNYFTE